MWAGDEVEEVAAMAPREVEGLYGRFIEPRELATGSWLIAPIYNAKLKGV